MMFWGGWGMKGTFGGFKFLSTAPTAGIVCSVAKLSTQCLYLAGRLVGSKLPRLTC